MTSKTILLLLLAAIFVAGTLTSGTLVSAQTAQSNVPDWIKNTAGWWAEGSIPENDFLQGIQWLINEGIIQVATAEKIITQIEFQNMVERVNELEMRLNEISVMTEQDTHITQLENRTHF